VDDHLESRLHQQLQKWRDDLINLSRSNRLLYFRHTKTSSLEIGRPGSAEALQRLNASGTSNFWKFHLPNDPEDQPNGDDVSPSTFEQGGAPGPGEMFVENKNRSQIEAGLRALERRSNQEFVDKGLWILYLGLGCLTWLDSLNEDTKVESPLLLVPVRLDRASLQAPFRMYETDDEIVVNPSLAVKLATDFEITLP
jgi:hypothetical protein